ncbi:hypothetical protein [Oryzobacter telluris]|uniref:hypothetical protein n=1 Tax=Oryzobacter telluris TaxID=3149179 RepID=UPI00370D29A5
MQGQDRDVVEWFSDRGLSALLDDTRLGRGGAWRALRTVVSVVVFVTRELWSGLVSTGPAMARTLPLLLGVVTFFFFTAEVWQSVGMLSGGAYTAAVLLFVVVSAAFLGSRKRLDLGALSTFDSTADLEEALAGTPLQDSGSDLEAPVTCPLTPGQTRTLRLVATVSRLVVTAVVGAGVLVFFTVLGTVAVPTQVVGAWTTVDPAVLAEIATDRRTFAVTAPLLKVAGFLAAFSALYYAVVSVVDPTMRQELRDTVTETVRGACAARLVVLRADEATDTSAA